MPTDPATYPLQLAAILSDRLRTAKQELVTQWLNRITARVSISAKRVFPTHELLNHVPLLIEGVNYPYSDRLAQVASAIGQGVLDFVASYRP